MIGPLLPLRLVLVHSVRGVSRIFERGGGSNISCFPKKRSSDFKRGGGVQWSDGGGGPVH